MQPFPAQTQLACALLTPDAMKARKLPIKRPAKPGSVESFDLAALRRQADWQGLAALSDEALIALIIAPDPAPGDVGRTSSCIDEPLTRARRLLGHTGGLAQLRQLRPHAYRDLGVLAEHEAARLSAALQLGYRAQQDDALPAPDRPFNSQLVIQWARPRLAGLEHEEVWVLCVNSHTALRSAWQVGRGGIHGCGLLARDILVPVVRDGANGFILVHNHPSGDPTPSPEDIALTRAISFAATSLCIPLLDHVVVARGGACSFFEMGLLER
jgi:DNA repair protein RadC